MLSLPLRKRLTSVAVYALIVFLTSHGWLDLSTEALQYLGGVLGIYIAGQSVSDFAEARGASTERVADEVLRTLRAPIPRSSEFARIKQARDARERGVEREELRELLREDYFDREGAPR